MMRRVSNPRTGEIRYEDLGPGQAVTRGIGGQIVQGMSADEMRLLIEKIARTERQRKGAAS